MYIKIKKRHIYYLVSRWIWIYIQNSNQYKLNDTLTKTKQLEKQLSSIGVSAIDV